MGVFMLNLIIASAHLLPEFLISDALNIIIMMMAATITVMIVSKKASKTCKKTKVSKKGHEVYHDNFRMDKIQD